jgi:hypothetical protein
MPPATLPLTGCDPVLMEQQPFDRPGDDLVDDVFIRAPLSLRRIEYAKARKCWRIPQTVDVLGRLPSPARIGTDRRIEDRHALVWVCEHPAVEEAAREIHDLDAVGLAYGPYCAAPHTDPSRACDQLELWAFSPESLILFLDRKRKHSDQSPNGELLGVARAIDGTAVEPRAGTLPVRRIWKPFPASLSLSC